MKITIETIPHDQQRYETIGDWVFTDTGDLHVRVSDMGNWKYEVLVGLHEAHEALLCRDRGITGEAVDAFDKQWNEENPEGVTEDEPGDDPRCPCRKEHFFATSVERLFAAELGVDWKEYGDTAYSL